MTGLFRAAKAIARRKPEEAPQPRRTRRGDTGKAFALAARQVVRHAQALPASLTGAAVYLLSTLDWLNIWQHGEQGYDNNDCNNINESDLLTPHL